MVAVSCFNFSKPETKLPHFNGKYWKEHTWNKTMACKPSAHGRKGQVDLNELEASPGYRKCSRTARAVKQGNPI